MFRQHLKCCLTAPRCAGTSSGFFCFSLLSQLSEPGRLSTAAVILRRWSTAVHFQPVERRVQKNLEGLVNVRLDELPGCRAATLTFFFFLMLTRRRRGLGERVDKILCWRPSNCTHYDACRRETAWVFPETLRSASRKNERPLQAQNVSHYRLDQSRVEAYTTGFSQTSIFIPSPFSGCTNGANGVKRRASFCLVFRSLNTTSSHRMFSMGYRRAKSTQENTNFQKEFFGKQLWDHYPRSLRPAGSDPRAPDGWWFSIKSFTNGLQIHFPR